MQLLKDAKALGLRAGVALKPGTAVEPYLTNGVVEEADMVLIMTVEPGFGGQSFMGDMMPKITAIRRAFPSKLIQVDGGIDTKTIATVAAAGANVIVSGSGVFKADSPAQASADMRKAVDDAIAKGFDAPQSE